MGDTDGSSEAAQSAQLEDIIPASEAEETEDTPKSGGFFSRVMGALSASDNEEEEEITGHRPTGCPPAA